MAEGDIDRFPIDGKRTTFATDEILNTYHWDAKPDKVVTYYESDVTYSFNALVFYAGEVYKSTSVANLNNTPHNNSLHWQTQTDNINFKMAEAFANGFNEEHEFKIFEEAGTVYAEVWRVDAAWNAGTTYDDCIRVLYNGKLYGSIQDTNLNKNPESNPDYWRYIQADDGNLHCTVDGTDLIYTLDTTTNIGTDGHARKALTAGTASSPNLTQVYAIKSAGSTDLTLDQGAGLPTGCVAFAGYCYIQDPATVAVDKAITQQRYTNSFYRTVLGKSLLGAIRERLRIMGIQYFSGADSSVTITTNPVAKDSIRANVTAAQTYQLWPQSFPDNSTGAPEYIVLNDPTSPFRVVTDLAELTEDANGDPLHVSNNTKYALKIIGIQQSGTDVSPRLGVLLPSGSYSTDDEAILDSGEYDATSVPFAVRFTVFQVCRLVLNYQTASSGTITNILGGNLTQDRRGWVFTAQGGGGAGTGIINEYSDAVFRIYNASDPTKKIAFDATSVATATTRTIIMPNHDVNLGVPTTAKTTPVDADVFSLWDSAASFIKKKVTFANLKAAIISVLKQGDITQEINNQTGTTYTLVNSDHGKLVTLSNAATIKLTVPSGLRSDFECVVQQKGAGAIDVVASGTTINVPEGVPGSSTQWAMFGLRQTDTNVFTASVGSYAEFSNPNLLINADGTNPLDQRNSLPATSAVTATYYADGWLLGHDIVGQVDLSVEADGGYRTTISSYTSGTIIQHLQQLEGYNALEGKTVTLSASVRSNTSNFKLRIVINASVVASSNIHTGGGGFETLTVTATLGAILTGLYTDMIAQGGDLGLNSFIEFEWIKFEESPKPTKFRAKSKGDNQTDCEWFHVEMTTQAINGTKYIAFPSTIRDTPNVSVSVGSASNITRWGFDLTHTAAASCNISASKEL